MLHIFRCVACNLTRYGPNIVKSNVKNSRIRILRNYHCNTSVCYAKLFISTENTHAYNVVQTLDLSKDLFNSRLINEADFNRYLDREWRKATSEEIVQAFQNILEYCVKNEIPVSDTRLDKLVDGVMDNAEKLTDQQLETLLKCLPNFPPCENYNSHNFHDLWSCLDDICTFRMSEWSIDKMLYFAELWYHLHLGKITDYTFAMLDRIERKAQQLDLTKEQLVKVFFYFNICRRRTVCFDYQYAVERVVHAMTADELAIVAMGFFKTKTKIKPFKILEAMCNKIIQEHDKMHEITLAALLKIIRYSSIVQSWGLLQEVLKSLLPEIDRLSILCCIHIAILGTNLQVYNRDVLQKISEKMIKYMDDVENLRLKDIERLILALTMFDFDPVTKPDIFQMALNQLYRPERRQELTQYPRVLGSVLHYLSIRNIYAYDLMDHVMNPEYIKNVYGAQVKTTPRELYVLDSSIDIECPDYKGNRLSTKARLKACKWMTEYVPERQKKNMTASDRLFFDTYDAVAELLGGETYLSNQYILPHFHRADIICCFDEKLNKFVQPKGFDKYSLSDIKYPEKCQGLRWIAIVPLGVNSCVRVAPEELGNIKMKTRQLRKIDYEPVLVYWCEFTNLTKKERIEYMRRSLPKL